MLLTWSMHASSCVPNAGSGRFASAQSARWQYWAVISFGSCSAFSIGSRNAPLTSRIRGLTSVNHVDLDQHAHVGRRLQQLVQVTGADRGVQADAELGELDRHRGARRVLRDGADGVDVALDRGRGLRQVVDGLAEQVEADVDPLGPQLAGDGDRLMQRGAGDEADDEHVRQMAGAHQLLEPLVRGCDEEQTLDH